jgi:hypothetical protein
VYEKRNATAIEDLNPATHHHVLLVDLLKEHGPAAITERLDRIDEGMLLLSDPSDPPGSLDDFEASGVKSPKDIKEIFTNRLFLGCEEDDPMNPLVFAKDINPHQTELRAIFVSDLGPGRPYRC